jgi:chaperonin GroES
MKTRGGIIIPDTSKEKPIRGEVVAVADKDKKGDPLTVVVGDIVLYGKYAGSEIELEGESYLISMETDILAILK